MRLRLVWVLLIGTGSASFATGQQAVAERIAPATLAEVNQVLQGRKAMIELANGRVVERAKKVVVTEDVTTWKVDGKSRDIGTSEIARITATGKQRRVMRGALWGLLIGAVVGGIAGSSGEDTNSPLDGIAVVAGVGIGAALGAVSGGVAGSRGKEPVVVFEAPLEQYLETPVDRGASSASDDNPPADQDEAVLAARGFWAV